MKKLLLQLAMPTGTVLLAALILVTRFIELFGWLERILMMISLGLMLVGLAYIVACMLQKKNPYDRYDR